MKRTLLLAMTAIALQGVAQTDISDFFLVNSGFDLNCNYGTSVQGNISGDVINEVYGWQNETTANYTVAGTFAYNPNVSFNNSSPLPAAGFNNSTGGCLGLTTGWGMKLLYSQKVTLPKGVYRIRATYFNVGTATTGQSALQWAPEKKVKTSSKVKNFPVNQWLEDELTFTVATETPGAINVGFTSNASVGSNDNAKILVDYVKLYCDELDKSSLGTLITEAKSLYGDGTGNGATEFSALIESAQRIFDDANASVTDILSSYISLKREIEIYRINNASPDNPIDMTSAIVNPDFEQGTNGWLNDGMIAQTNSSFAGKSGGTYLERWVNVGSKLPDVAISQQLSGLRNGAYILRAATGHISQASSGSSQNNGKIQTGALLFAGYCSVEAADQTKAQDLRFVVVDSTATIGFKTTNASGNWVCFDNCRLLYVGNLTTADFAVYLKGYIEDIRSSALVLKGQNTLRDALVSAISSAEALVALEATTIEDLQKAKSDIDSAREAFLASSKSYSGLETELEYARKVRTWWESNTTRVAPLIQAIVTAETAYNDDTLTPDAVSQATAALNRAVKKVDKRVYTAQWSMGDINDSNNAWYIGRTRQSKDWILFWEKGYGDNPKTFNCGNYVTDIDEILKHAETAFRFYTDSLKYLTPGRSKTDNYKMVIRLRYEPTEWEASGSGVDNIIGLLTLTPWAAPSRNWQTLYHEIGHCFQYQVHCDNNDDNGWMYAPADGYGCAFWEQCAQWQAYKIMPDAQFSSEWMDGYFNNVHKHILHESARYNNFFVHDYWCFRHGMDFIGRLWNESKRPEDAVEAYMRINGITVSEFYDEMYDCAARFATWDIPHLREYGASKIDSRPQPALNAATDGAWRIAPSVAPENTGHNIIRLNAPKNAKTVQVRFTGLNNADGYRVKNPTAAEWRYGFVALLNDGSRVYSDMGKTTYASPEGTLSFDCPANVAKLYMIVSGGSSRYWRQKWDDNDDNDEQWPYELLFGNTNKYGSADRPELSAVEDMSNDVQLPAIWTEAGILHIGETASDVAVTLTHISGVNIGTFSPATEVALGNGFYIATITNSDRQILSTIKIIVK